LRPKAAPPFITRFGIHVAEAVVGNLGSDERMVIHSARHGREFDHHRLEGLNKQLWHHDPCSEQVYARSAAQLAFRSIDTVVARV